MTSNQATRFLLYICTHVTGCEPYRRRDPYRRIQQHTLDVKSWLKDLGKYPCNVPVDTNVLCASTMPLILQRDECVLKGTNIGR